MTAMKGCSSPSLTKSWQTTSRTQLCCRAVSWSSTLQQPSSTCCSYTPELWPVSQWQLEHRHAGTQACDEHCSDLFSACRGAPVVWASANMQCFASRAQKLKGNSSGHQCLQRRSLGCTRGVHLCGAAHLLFNSLQCNVLLQSFENPQQDTCMAANHALAHMS